MNLDELTTTAKLAMLDLSASEKNVAAFSEMLDYFSKMMEIDVSELEPTTHALAQGNRLRVDQVRTTTGAEESDRLVALAPDYEDRFIRIPNVL